MNLTRRLCIYVTYNRKHRIKEYVGYMLKALDACCEKLFVVCNFPKPLEGEKYLHPYADAVFCRENRGYDAGAYKDALCTLLGWNTVYEYDELIFVNDSFFGPFYDLDRYFNLMADVKCDFWGMTRHPSGELKDIDYRFESHIQSYFLVFRRRVLKSEEYKEFWEQFKYPNTYYEAITNFEIGINKYLKKNGFTSMALTDVWGMDFKDRQNPLYIRSLELVRDMGLPVLKKKSLSISNYKFENVLKTVEFLDINGLYATDWIWEVIDGQFNTDACEVDGSNCLEAFCRKYKRVYIYGAGVCGKNLALYFEQKGWKNEGIVVSDVTQQNTECTAFDDVNVDEKTGIIVAVIDREVSREIVQYVCQRCRREQLFLVSECAVL